MSDPEQVAVALSRDDLTVIIGGVWEALFALGDEEFGIRVGPTAEEAKALLERLASIREDLPKPV